jgi:hypothetical protein
MRGVTLEAKIRGVERQTGCEIKIFNSHDDPPVLVARDMEMDRVYMRVIHAPSKSEGVLAEIHNEIYRNRGEAKYKQQAGLCCFCHLPLNGVYEVDHIIPRGWRGRDDRLANLQCCHIGFVCDGHRKKHGG